MNNPSSDKVESRTQTASFDSVEARHAIEKLRSEQNLPFGILAGTAAALVGAGIWAGITAATEYQIGFMAIGVGILVGLAVRVGGKGLDPIFGIIGAVLAGLGCGLGNLLAGGIFLAAREQVGILQVLSALDFELAKALMVAMFNPIDLLFYGLAIYEGYRFSFRPLVVPKAG